MKRILLIFFLVSGVLFAQDEILLDSANAFSLTMRDNQSTPILVKQARAIIIFPTVKKVGFFVGGMYGKGVAVYNDGVNKSVRGAEISNASLGFQFGYEDNYLVLFIMDDKIIENMQKSKLTLGADATVAVGSASANVGTFNALTQDIYAYTNKMGIFVGASLGGVVLSTKNSVVYDANTYGYHNLINTIYKGN